MSVIDIHTHAFPDGIALRAMETLSAKAEGFPPAGDGTVRHLIETMDAAGIDIAVVCAIATKPGQVSGIVKWQREIISDRIMPFCSIHPADEKPDKWLRQMVKAGFVGIKLHPMYQDFVIDDELMFAIYAGAIENDLAVAIHCGYDIGFANDPLPDRASPRRVATVLEKFPQLRLLCTHMGGWRMWDQVQTHLLGREVYLETSFALGHMSDEQLLAMIQNHGSGRVCFGSDWPWNNPAGELQKLNSLGLDEKPLDSITFKNAARLLKICPD